MNRLISTVYFLVVFFPPSVLALSPEEVAAGLNSRFNSSGDECPDKPGYACSGVLIHTKDSVAGGSTGIEVSEHGRERGTVSFSFLRNDLRINRPYYEPVPGLNNFSGIILSSKVYALNLKILCMYALYGDSDFRRGAGCGEISLNKGSDYSTCEKKGILTAKQLVDIFYKNTEEYSKSCSWSAQDATSFNEWAKIPSLIQGMELHDVISNNEVLLSEWSSLPQNTVPLEAFYYAVNYKESSDSSNRLSAQGFQYKYFSKYGKFIPIIRIDMAVFSINESTSKPEPFIYDQKDQVVSPPSV